MLIQQTFTCFWRDKFDMAIGVSALAGVSSRGQPLDLTPWRFSFSRHASLTQELNLPGPAAVSICSKRSSSNRMFLTVLFERSKLRLDVLSCIGMYHSYNVILDGTYHRLSKQDLKQRSPQVLPTPTGLSPNR